MYSALAMYIARPPTSRGMPALGCALSLRRVTCTIRSTPSRMPCGPTEQFRPMTSAPRPSSQLATSSGEAPNGVRPSLPIVIWATTGIVGSTSRAARTACPISSRSPKVSMMNRSAPPSFSAAICSANAARASSTLVGPYGSSLMPNGPTAPATRWVSPATSRAICAAARLKSPACVWRPYWASLIRLAPKVFVSRTSAPAFAYSACTARTRSGARVFSSS